MSGAGDGEGSPRAERGNGERRLARGVARAIVWLRFLIIPAWIALAVLAALKLPSIFNAGSGSIGNLLPESSQAIRVEQNADKAFGIPLLSRTLVVATEPRGLSESQVTAATRFIVAYDRHPTPGSPVRGAAPLADISRLASDSSHAGKSLVAFVFVRPTLSPGEQAAAAWAFAARLRAASGIAQFDVTGPVPARYQDGQIASARLPWVEVATIVLVVGILAVYFRSFGIPLLGLATVAIAYECASHFLGWFSLHGGVTAPQEVEPVIVALLFGALTDYVVFFVSGYRQRLQSGLSSREAAQRVAAELLPVVLTAGLMISGALLTLMLSGVQFLSTFGPGMAIAITVGVAVALTFVPAVLATMGPLLLRPGRSIATPRSESTTPRGRVVGVAARFPALVAGSCIAVLLAAATGIRELTLGDPVMRGLPTSTSARRGYDAASRAFTPGILGPTMFVVSQPGIVDRRPQLATLQGELAKFPGVSAVLGPANQPLERPYGVVLAPGGNAARFMVSFSSDPEGAAATDTLATIQNELPAMLANAGLPHAHVGIAGDTAITQELNGETEQAFLRVTPAALLVLILLLWALLRSRTAPIYLVAASALVVAAALGLTVYVFHVWLGYGELAFYVPIASAILLLALGSDYNVFLVGRIWREAERRHLRAAVRTAGSRAARAITVAGMILALSFAALAIIPTLGFREVAFMMAVGLMLDAFVARTLLIPALIALFGRGTERGEAAREPAPTPATDAAAVADPREGRAA
jgi:putative drug exporter of the RND superfamily